jgi:hypothetical protein
MSHLSKRSRKYRKEKDTPRLLKGKRENKKFKNEDLKKDRQNHPS